MAKIRNGWNNGNGWNTVNNVGTDGPLAAASSGPSCPTGRQGGISLHRPFRLKQWRLGRLGGSRHSKSNTVRLGLNYHFNTYAAVPISPNTEALQSPSFRKGPQFAGPLFNCRIHSDWIATNE